MASVKYFISTFFISLILTSTAHCSKVISNTKENNSFEGARIVITTNAPGVADRLYIAREHVIQCYDAKMSHLIWTAKIPHGTIDVGPIMVDNTLVYISGDMSTINGVDANDGSYKWSNAIQSQSAHLTAGEKEVFLTTAPGMGVQSFDVGTGKRLWTYQYGGPGTVYELLQYDGKIYTDAYILNARNGKLISKNSVGVGIIIGKDNYIYKLFNNDSIAMLDAKSNATKWARTLPTLLRGIAMSVGDGSLFLVSYDGAPFVARSGVLESFSGDTGNVLWKIPLESASEVLLPNPLGSDNDAVYLLRPSRPKSTRFTALDAATGKDLWDQELNGALEGPPLIVGNIIYITGGPNIIYELDKVSGRLLFERILSKE